MPNENAYGAHDQTVLLSRTLYAHADATVTRCTSPARHPERQREHHAQRRERTNAALRTVDALSRPSPTGLSVRPTAASRSASIQSFDQPTDS